jgi:ribosomal protein S18 acetylase RimI-like enzyme
VSVEVARLGPGDVDAVADDVVDVYREAFGEAPYFEGEAEVDRFANEALPSHAGRRGFRLVVARQSGVVVGFGYGYTGEAGQWWHDWVVSELGQPAAARWADGAFEVVDLAVRPIAQGRGTGGRLHDALLEGLPHRTALLSTWDAETPARLLYLARGWVTLRSVDRPGVPPVLLMGRELPAASRRTAST